MSLEWLKDYQPKHSASPKRATKQRKQPRRGSYRIIDATTLAVWKFITKWHDEHGYPPSYGDIASGCGLSGRTLLSHTRALIQRHYVRRLMNTVELLKRPETAVLS